MRAREHIQNPDDPAPVKSRLDRQHRFGKARNACRSYRMSLVAAALLCAVTLPVGAAVFTVNDTRDAADSNPDGNCAALITVSSSPPTFVIRCTLRAAVQEANSLFGKDTIQVPAGLYALTLDGTEGASALNAAVGDLDVTETVDILGQPGAVIDGGSRWRIFQIAAPTLLRDLMIRNGSDAGAGGILSTASGLTLERVEIAFCNSDVAGGAFLRAFRDFASTVDLHQVSIHHNIGGATGGVVFMGNGSGGLEAEVRESAIYRNHGEGSGGGLWIASDATHLRLRNTTVSGNSAVWVGGGIYFEAPGSLTNVTVVGNHAALTGGVATNIALGKIHVGQTILWGNTHESHTEERDCGGILAHGQRFESGGYNFLGNLCRAWLGTGTDRVGVDPQLLALGHFGGTPSHLPRVGSPVIDVVSSSVFCPPNDQRGEERPVDGDGVGGALCDSGAVERQLVEPFVIFVDDFESGDTDEWSATQPP